jgi:hypothetical protein
MCVLFKCVPALVCAFAMAGTVACQDYPLAVMAQPGPGAVATWGDFRAVSGTVTVDRHGEVIIVGGGSQGPVAGGGAAVCQLVTGNRSVENIAFRISTNGARFHGKGCHSTMKGGAVSIYVNDALVHRIVCNVRGRWDYWPERAPLGSAGYTTGTIDVTGLGIRGPVLAVKIVAHGNTAIDINALAVSIP